MMTDRKAIKPTPMIEDVGDPATWADLLAFSMPEEPWKGPSKDWSGFHSAAVEAADLANGRELLKCSQPLNFDPGLNVRYVGEARSNDGCRFYSFLFQRGGLDVLVWIEDDLHRSRLIWKGEDAVFERTEILLRMLEGETFAHLR